MKGWLGLGLLGSLTLLTKKKKKKTLNSTFGL